MAYVLLIDDDDEVRATLKAILECADHEVTEASNGAVGLQCLKSGRAQIVITDILMPEKEGVETIIELRKAQPGLPIIAISGGGATRNLAFLEIAQKLGADRILTKPVDADVFLGAVDELLRQAGGEQSAAE